MDRTENILRALFDFQRFAGNKRLDSVIRAAEGAPFGLPLEDGEMELNAAGEPETWRLLKEDGKKP